MNSFNYGRKNKKYNCASQSATLKITDIKRDNTGTELTPAVVQAFNKILTTDHLDPQQKTLILNQIKYCKVTQIGNKKVVKVISQTTRNFIYNRLTLNKIISGIINNLKFDYDAGQLYFDNCDKLSQKAALKRAVYQKGHSLELSDIQELNQKCQALIENIHDKDDIKAILTAKNHEFFSLFGASFTKRYYYRLKDILFEYQYFLNDDNFADWLQSLTTADVIAEPQFTPCVNMAESVVGHIINPFKPSTGDFPNFDLQNSTYVIFDIETTGLNSQRDRIIEIAAVKIHRGQVIAEFSSLVNPQVKISDFISNLTNLKNTDLINQPLLKTVLPQFLEFCQDSILVAHNAKFDYGFITAKYLELFQTAIEMPYIDTLALAKFYFINKPTILKQKLNYKLTLKSLSKHFKVKLTGQHRALNDAYTTKTIFIKLLHYLHRENITKYHDLRFANLKFGKLITKPFNLKKIGYQHTQNPFTVNIKKYLAFKKSQELKANDVYLSDSTHLNNQILFNLFNHEKFKQLFIASSSICCSQQHYLNHIATLKATKSQLELELKAYQRREYPFKKNYLAAINDFKNQIQLIETNLLKSYDDYLHEHFNTLLKYGRDGDLNNQYFKVILALNYLLGQNQTIKAFELEMQQKNNFKNRDQFLKSKKAFRIKAEHNFIQSQTISFLTLTVPASKLTQNPIFMHEVLRKFWDNVNKKLKKLGHQPSQDFPRMTVTELTKIGTLHYHNLFKTDLVDILGVIKGNAAIDYCYQNFNADYPKVAQANSYIFQNRFRNRDNQFKTEFIKFHKKGQPGLPIQGGTLVIPQIFVMWIEAFKTTLRNPKIIAKLSPEFLEINYDKNKQCLISKLPLPTSQDYTYINLHQGLKHFYHQGSYRSVFFKASNKNFRKNIIKYIAKYMSKTDNNADNNVLRLFNKRVFISSRACKKPVVIYFQCLQNEIIHHESLKGLIFNKKYMNTYNFVNSSIRNPIKKHIISNYLKDNNHIGLMKAQYDKYQFLITRVEILILQKANRLVLQDYDLNKLKYVSYLQHNLYFFEAE
ncbi:MAG: exonuclease domain-containing protein [Candidatus Phytoplasma pyri]